MNKFTGSESVGAIVAEFPGAADIFKKYRIDFCCGGNRQLSAVMAEMKLNGIEVVAEINAAYSDLAARREASQGIDWRTAPLTELIDHIIDTHHVYLNRELPKISELVVKILRVHGAGHSELARVHKLFHALKAELESHLIKEEEILFPLIKEYAAAPSDTKLSRIHQVIDEIESEHTGAGDILKELRTITGQFIAPADGCATYKLAYAKLEELEGDIFQHIHLENNILHPRLGYKG